VIFGISLTAQAQTPVLTNRTPEAAKVTPTPSAQQSPARGVATIEIGPVLIRPDDGRQGPQLQRESSYYICLRHVTRVLVTDARGHTDDLFNLQFAGFMGSVTDQTVRNANYEFVGKNDVYVVVPVTEKYSITFETEESGSVFLEIVKGWGNADPDEVIRYRDLVLNGRRAKFEITPRGVEPLRIDTDGNGRFASVIEPTASVRGRAAHDTRGPEITFQILERTGSTILVAIDTKDESGVKSVSYSLDIYRDSSGGYRMFPYRGPIRIDLEKVSSLFVKADDYAGNRSGTLHDLRK
jgi:hypothetical protein